MGFNYAMKLSTELSISTKSVNSALTKLRSDSMTDKGRKAQEEKIKQMTDENKQC